MKITRPGTMNFNKIANQKTLNKKAAPNTTSISFGVNYSYWLDIKVPTNYYTVLDRMAWDGCNKDELRAEAARLCMQAEEEEFRKQSKEPYYSKFDPFRY